MRSEVGTETDGPLSQVASIKIKKGKKTKLFGQQIPSAPLKMPVGLFKASLSFWQRQGTVDSANGRCSQKFLDSFKSYRVMYFS